MMWQRIIFLCCFVLLTQVPDVVRGQALVLAPIDIAWPVALNATCVPKSTVIDRIPTPCLPYITYDSIYVDYNQATREKLGRITISNSWSSPACINASYRIGCLYMFRPCVEVPVPGTNGTTTNETTAVARFMCREGCKQVYNACYEAIYASLKVVGHLEQLQAATSCDPPWFVMYGQNLPGVQTFPDTTQYSVPVTNDNYTTPVFYTNMTCYADNLNVTTEPPYNICPTGLYYTEGTCALLCPEPLLSDSEFNAVAGITGGFGWFSFLLMILLMFSFLLEHKRRTFPHDLFIYFVASLLLLSFSFVIASVIGFRNMDCEDDKTPNTWGSVGCTVQGMLYVYFSLTSVFWWLVISFNYFLLIVMGYQSKPLMAWREWLTGIINGGADWRPWFRWETIYVFYHIFSWGLPLLPLIISLAAHRLGYGGHDVWCTIHSGEDAIVRWEILPLGGLKHVDGDPRNLWHVILFDVPIFCAVCLGCGLLVAVVVYGVWKAKGKIWTWSFFKQHWRLILFLGFYFYIYVFVFSFHIHQSVEREAQYEAYDDYIDCSFNKDILNGVDYVINCPLDHVINFPLWVIMALNVASQGIIAFLILGTTRVLVHQFWWFISIPFVLLKLMEPIPLDLPEKNETGPEVVGDPKDDVKEMDTYYSDDDVAPVRN